MVEESHGIDFGSRTASNFSGNRVQTSRRVWNHDIKYDNQVFHAHDEVDTLIPTKS